MIFSNIFILNLRQVYDFIGKIDVSLSQKMDRAQIRWKSEITKPNSSQQSNKQSYESKQKA